MKTESIESAGMDNFHFVYNPTPAILTQDTLGFLHQYSSQYYPRVASSVLQKYRFLMRALSSIKRGTGPDRDTYSMVHASVQDGRGVRYVMQECFTSSALKVSVKSSSKEERAEIAERVRCMRSLCQGGELLRGQDLAVYLSDELRLDPGLWQNTRATTTMTAVDFFNLLCEFFSKSPGASLVVLEYKLTKTPESTSIFIELLIPGVISHTLQIGCEFL